MSSLSPRSTVCVFMYSCVYSTSMHVYTYYVVVQLCVDVLGIIRTHGRTFDSQPTHTAPTHPAYYTVENIKI